MNDLNMQGDVFSDTKRRQGKPRIGLCNPETRACIMMAPSLSSHHLKQERWQAFCLTRHGKIKPLWNNQRKVADEHHHLAPHCLITVTAASICNLHAVAVAVV